MDYMDYLDSYSKFKSEGGYKPGLGRMKAALKRLGNPEKKINTIHVAGTNGKGSTSAMMASILKQAGYNVGFFSSPHLHHFRERFRINGVPIAEKELELMVKQIRPAIEEVSKDPELGRMSYFEVVTVLAFNYFAYKKLDLVVLEVGLGGRLDSTNVVHPLVSVITNIGHDHMEYLGDTLAEIGKVKAGIIKDSVPVVTGVEKEEAFAAVKEEAEEKNAKIYRPLKEAEWEKKDQTISHQEVDLNFGDKTYGGLKIGLSGDHQIYNAALAIKVMELLKADFEKITDQVIRKGLAEVRWPGRLELVGTNPPILLDGAHNIEGIKALASFLDEVKDQYDNLYLVMSILKDKRVEPMIRELAYLADGIIFTQNHNFRASTAEELGQLYQEEGIEVVTIPNFEEAINQAVSKAENNDLICITGSLYTIAEAREILKPGDEVIL